MGISVLDRRRSKRACFAFPVWPGSLLKQEPAVDRLTCPCLLAGFASVHHDAAKPFYSAQPLNTWLSAAREPRINQFRATPFHAGLRVVLRRLLRYRWKSNGEIIVSGRVCAIDSRPTFKTGHPAQKRNQGARNGFQETRRLFACAIDRCLSMSGSGRKQRAAQDPWMALSESWTRKTVWVFLHLLKLWREQHPKSHEQVH